MTDAEKALAVINAPGTVTEFKQQYNTLVTFVGKSLKQGKDYGIIPGTRNKTLLQPGSEKIAKFYGLMPDTVTIDKLEDWEKGFFFYRAKCTLTHFHTGKFAGSATRTCNSKEKSFSGGYKKSPDEMAALANNIEARAHKRAIVAAVKFATNATDIFDEDPEGEVEHIQPGEYTQKEDPAKAKMMARLFAAANERCFSPDLFKQVLHKKYQVESVKDLDGVQLMEAYNNLMVDWVIGGMDGKPKKIWISPQPAQSGVIVEPSAQNEPEVVDQDKELEKNVDDIFTPTGEKSGEIKCRKCGKVLEPNEKQARVDAGLPGYFCNKEEEGEYWGDSKKKSYPWDRKGAA